MVLSATHTIVARDWALAGANRSSENPMKRLTLHLVSLLAVCALLVYYFFAVGRFNQDAWYRIADADAVFAAQTVALLNDGDLTYIHHPDAAVIAAQTVVHQILGSFSEAHSNLGRLTGRDHPDLVVLLTTAVQTGRYLSLLMAFCFAVILYALLLRITGRWIIAFVFMFLIVFSKGVLRHIGIVRPELPSIVFFYAAVLFLVVGCSCRKQWVSVLSLALAGLACGFAILSKIQIAPSMILLLPIVAIMLFLQPPKGLCALVDRAPFIGVGLATGNMLIFPNWALAKPSFLTPESYARLDQNNQAVYGRFGPNPAPFSLLAIVALAVLLAAAVAPLILRRRRSGPAYTRLIALSIIANLIVLGAILAAYSLLLPSSKSWSAYTSNTNQVVYATLTNLTSGGSMFLSKAKWSFIGSTREILGLHKAFSSIAAINIVWIAAAGALASMVRFVWPRSRSRVLYLAPPYLFAAALMVDHISMLRLNSAYSIYAAYSVPLYGLCLGLFCWLELERVLQRGNKTRAEIAAAVVGVGILGIGLANLGTTGWSILRKKHTAKAGNYTEQQAWTWIGTFVPQLKLLDGYAKVSRLTCLKAEDISAGAVEEIAGRPDEVWDFRMGDSALFRSSESGRLGLRGFGLSTDGYPIFDRQSGGLYLRGRTVFGRDGLPTEVGDLTVVMWLKILQPPNALAEPTKTYLFGINNSTLTMFLHGRGSKWSVVGYYGDTSGEVIAQLDPVYGSLWTQLALSKRGEQLSLYVNGAIARSAKLRATKLRLSSLPGVNLWNGKDPARFEVGSILLWLKGLSEGDVKDIFRRQLWGPGGGPGGFVAWESGCFGSPRELLKALGESRR
jgi:hypothetical protein